MSRRSLRLDEGLLDRSLPHSSASFSVGGASWRSSRVLKSRRSQQHSVSCSESFLVHTPHKLSSQSLHNSSHHSVTSDASLLSSLLDESSIQESTLVDTLWGLDNDVDPKESTILADSTLTGPGHAVQPLTRVHCKDCDPLSDGKESVSTYCTSSKYIAGGLRPSEQAETTTIYCRDRGRKSQMDVLHLWLDWSVLCVRRAAACCASVLTHTWQVCRGLASKVTEVNKHGARSARRGAMKETTTNLQELRPNGSVCGDSKQRLQTDVVASSPSSWSSVAACVLGLMWSATVFTASCLFQLSRSAASALWPLTQRAFSASWSTGCAAGKTAGEALRGLSRRWRHVNTSVFLTRFALCLLVVLLPLMLSLCWFGPAVLQSVLPAANITDESTTVSDSQSSEGAVESSREVQPYVEPIYSRPPPTETPSAEKEESARLVRLEQSLTALWERVEARGQRAEQRHREVLQLYTDLQQQQQQQQLSSAQSGTEDVETWLSRLVDQQLAELRTLLEEEGQQREQLRQQDLVQQQSHTSRLDRLELQLQTLAARTQDVQWRQETTTVSPSPAALPAVSVGVGCQSHDALLAEVTRLEVALEDMRRDVEGLSGFQDGCRQLDRIQQMISGEVSAQVREEVRALVYGNQLTVGGGASGDDPGLPESLLQWLSQQYVSGVDLQAALTSLERSILQNISLQLEQLEQLGQRRSEEALGESVLHTARTAGAAVTQEDVHAIVKNALRLFSQDQTGLADYALESGGGSILSTRCSETYETKAALLSLFGVPLWYFSQSPRAVIQPDVHPGNCWAFRGSTGFLVIRLSMRILPTAFSLEHIPKALAPSGALHSAPRDFCVFGLDDESQERGTLLGTYTYDEDGEALQTYPVTEENDRAFQVVEVQVLSNWGHPEYTCMYRFRVHGTPSDP
ncbi:SUN domain-containing protein 1-like isoform X2 [Mastacembelus armatus]|nr:SUN domain-containing protein 1-like isoform X2 [Mastacembelus armatus]XP_033181628.1 SUN domain-containing protein 1-like isoform X2 [Mastacembelus armatus]